jgi:hypothetical protein
MLAALRRGRAGSALLATSSFCVPSMFDSSEVKVLYST